VLPSLATAVHHPRAGAWLAFGPGQHRCPGDELTLAALEEFATAFFARHPSAYLTTSTLVWRGGPLSTPRQARFAVRKLRRRGAGDACCQRCVPPPVQARPPARCRRPGTGLVAA
jgi:hypothetical protein